MLKARGKTIYREHGDDGIVEIVDDASTRSMYFGSWAKQSTMYLDDPVELALTYTRSMMSCLLFRPQPRSALVIGLGGGSLVKFLLHHFPDCRIDVVEQRESVVSLAREYFQLPDDERLGIHISDGAEFVAATPRNYDIILVDAYGPAGMSRSVVGESFFSACHARLIDDGVLSANLWSNRQAEFREALHDLDEAFAGRVLRLPVARRGNVIMLGLRRPLAANWHKLLRPRALELGKALEIDFREQLRTLRRHNGSFLKRLMP